MRKRRKNYNDENEMPSLYEGWVRASIDAMTDLHNRDSMGSFYLESRDYEKGSEDDDFMPTI